MEKAAFNGAFASAPAALHPRAILQGKRAAQIFRPFQESEGNERKI
jgi:hypothetical protein